MTDQPDTQPTEPQQVLGHTLTTETAILPLEVAMRRHDEAYANLEGAGYDLGRSLTYTIEQMILAEHPDADSLVVAPVFDYNPGPDSMTMFLVADKVTINGHTIAKIGSGHPVQKHLRNFSRLSPHKTMRLHLGTGWWDEILPDQTPNI